MSPIFTLIANQNSLKDIEKHLDNNALDINEKNEGGHTLIVAAAKAERFDVVAEIARRYRATAQAAFNHALWLAVEKEHLAAVEALLQAGATTDYVVKNYETQHFTQLPSYVVDKQTDDYYQQRISQDSSLLLATADVYLVAATKPKQGDKLLALLAKYDTRQKKNTNFIVYYFEKFKEVWRTTGKQKTSSKVRKYAEGPSDTPLAQAKMLAEKLHFNLHLQNTLSVNGSQTNNSMEKTLCTAYALNHSNVNTDTSSHIESDEAKKLNSQIESDQTQLAKINPLEKIYVYLLQTYRPQHNDYINRFNHFASLLARLAKSEALDKGTVQEEISRFKTKFSAFWGTQRYHNLVNALLEIKPGILKNNYQEFSKKYLTQKKTYLGLTEAKEEMEKSYQQSAGPKMKNTEV